MMTSYHGSDHPDYIRAWRGQRYVTFRCSNCGQDFYAEEPQPGPGEEVFCDDSVIYDEDELRVAEEDLRRWTEEEGDHRYRPGGQ